MMCTPVQGLMEGRVNQGSSRGAREGFRWVEWMKCIRLMFVLTTLAGVSGPESDDDRQDNGWQRGWRGHEDGPLGQDDVRLEEVLSG
jgi:hypothetical protein